MTYLYDFKCKKYSTMLSVCLELLYVPRRAIIDKDLHMNKIFSTQ